jgi:hypothetical protein
LPLSHPLEDIFAHNADLWFTAYAELLASLDALTHAWLHRCRNDVEAMRQATRQIAEWQTPTDMPRLRQAWLSDAIRRASEELAALSTGISALTDKATADFAKAARRVGEPPCGVSGEMLEAAGNKPSTPRPMRMRTRDHEIRFRVGAHNEEHTVATRSTAAGTSWARR